MTGSKFIEGGQFGSVEDTDGVRVAVYPKFLPDQSDPTERRWVFAYRIRITNNTERPVSVRRRYWLIVDADGQAEQVRGEGVVGQQPRIAPGETFEYKSFCPLKTDWGTMEGEYTLQRSDGTSFKALIGRFFLVADGSRQPSVHG